MTTAVILAFAMILDACLGEPRWLWRRLPHPVVIMGRVISRCETMLNKGAAQQLKGLGMILGLAAAALLLGYLLSMLGWVAEAVIAAILLAQKSLVQHVQTVANDLRLSLGDARRSVAMIVGRDTAQMNGPDVARAAIESAAENLSDGVIAPAFWFLVAGLPGLLLYKLVNTADSMIGHRTPRYEAFGWAAARLDDLLNLVPARLCAGIITLSSGSLRDWPIIRQQARTHRSINAGWPEAAMAHALGIALSGPRVYNGSHQDFPHINPFARKGIGADDIDASCRVLWQAWAAGLCGLAIIAVVLAVVAS